MNRYPADISSIQGRTVVARIQVETMTGRHWFLVEIADTFQRNGLNMAKVNALPLLSGHEPEIFIFASHGGWGYSASGEVMASQLRDIAIVENGEVVEYLSFSASRPLAVNWPADQILTREA